MFEFSLWADALAALGVVAVLGWLLSIPLRNVSIVDSLWSLMFLLAGVVYALGAAATGPRAMLVVALLALWAVRLSAYITWRNHGTGEDRRYQAIRNNHQPGFVWKSFFIVFALQALLAWLISLPLLAAINSGAPLGWLDYAGMALWLVGFIFEAGGDYQLYAFKSKPENSGKVMERGFWRYTRHPNYFGDFCIWWGFYLLAVGAGGWWSIPAPVLMSFLLLKVSGVVLLEKDISERRPGYREYVRRTNAFFPGPVKSN